MIQRADTIGVFQIESRAQMSMLPRLKPASFYDLVIEVAIVRPGPIQGDMVHPYLRRRQGLEEVVYPSKELEAVLQKTLGVPLFQEQAMKIAIVAAGFTPAEADRLRRAMATFRRVGTIQTFQDKMIEGMAAKGYERDFAERCFRQIEGFGEYGFPESHAASFALLVYASCWMKCRYPDVFAAAMLNSQPLGFYAPAQLVRDAREHGVEVREVDVNLSDWDCALEPLPLSPRTGRGWRATARRMRGGADSACRDRSQTGVSAAPHPTASRPLLPEAGEGRWGRRRIHPRHAVDGRAHPRDPRGAARLEADRRRQGGRHAPTRRAARRRATIPCATSGCAAASRPPCWKSSPTPTPSARSASTGARRCGRCAGSTGSATRTRCRCSPPRGPSATPSRTRSCRRCRSARMWSRTTAACRCRLKAHPTSFMRARLAARGMLRSDALPSVKSGERVTVAGLVLVRQRPGTAKGVIFMTLEDEAGVANVIVWPKAFERLRAIVLGARFVAVTGKLQNEQGVIHVVADRMEDLTPMLGLLSEAGETIDPSARADEVKRPQMTMAQKRQGNRFAQPPRLDDPRAPRRPCRSKRPRSARRCRRDGIFSDAL